MLEIVHGYLKNKHYLCLFNYYNEWSYGCPKDPVVFKDVHEVERVIEYIDYYFNIDSVSRIIRDIDHCILLQSDMNENNIIKYRLMGFYKEETYTYVSSSIWESDQERKIILQKILLE